MTAVAEVRVDVPVPHLDRVFDYAIPDELRDQVRFGSRVRVRFSGRLVNGYVVSVNESSEHQLKPIERVLGDEPVLTPEVLRLVEQVAEHYAGSVHDVLRFAIPPRHARAERATAEAAGELSPPHENAWQEYHHGPNLIQRLRDGEHVRAVWSLAPAHDWVDDVEGLIRSVADGGVIVIAPDASDVQRIAARLGETNPAILLAEHGPERRYRTFLQILRGNRRIVIGTRSAVFAPVADLRLIIVWGDGDDSLWDPHAPYWNARDVAAIRAHDTGCSLVVGAPARTTEAQLWCDTGWAVSIAAARTTIATRAPRVQAIADEPGRIPHAAWRVMKEGLPHGPVLVQVGRRGYLPRVACQDCREPATCSCGGPAQLTSGHAVPSCQWCGALVPRCRACGGQRWRAIAVGVERTAEEFGRTFPNARIIWSAGEHIVRSVTDEPAIVVATQGAEPDCASGYAAVIILDARGALQRGVLRATEEAALRWFAAAARARPQAPCIVTADLALPAVQALVRWNAPWLAQRELADRTATGMPPVMRLIALQGDDAAAVATAAMGDVPGRILGPVGERVLLFVPRDDAGVVVRRVRAAIVQRALQRQPGIVTAMVDPREP